MNNSVQDAFKQNRARKNIILGGAAIMGIITIFSSVSTYQIFTGGFADLSPLFQGTLSFFATLVIEGTFVWLVYGFTRAFSSPIERLISMCGIGFLVVVMLVNLVTHFMMVKNIPLEPFQQAWVSWGAITVFIAILLIVLCITLADPVIRLIRLELRYLGAQQEKIIEAKTESLDSDRIQEAMAGRAEWEAGQLADRILGEAAAPRQLRPVSDSYSKTRSNPFQEADEHFSDLERPKSGRRRATTF